MPRALPALAWRYVVRSRQLLSSQRAACASSETSTSRFGCAHPLPGRYPLPARAGQRHADLRDVPCAGGPRPCRDAAGAPDATRPARDPWLFYGAPREAGLTIRGCRLCQAPLRRGAYLRRPRSGVRLGQPDIVLTRDLRLADMLLRLPSAAAAGRLRIARLRAGDGRRARPAPSRRATPARGASCRGSNGASRGYGARRRVHHANARASQELEDRFGRAPNAAVIPDGVRLGSGARRRPAGIAAAAVHGRPTPATSIRGRASTCCCTRWRSCRGCRHDRRRPDRRDRSRAARRPGARQRLSRSRDVHGWLPPASVAGTGPRPRAGPAEHADAHLRALHLAAQAVRVHGGRPANRGLRSGRVARGAAARGQRAAGRGRALRRPWPRRFGVLMGDRRWPPAWPMRAFDGRGVLRVGARAPSESTSCSRRRGRSA